MSNRCVVLLGMMGAGKSKVGKALAEAVGYKFVDTDALIERKAGKRVGQIFREAGEPAFRQMEAEAIAALAGTKGCVISPGGGAVLNPDNFRMLDGLGMTVYLRASARELYQRIKNDGTRPLMQTGDPRAEMARLLAEREPTYKRAAVTVDTEDLAIEEVVQIIIDEMAKRTSGDG